MRTAVLPTHVSSTVPPVLMKEIHPTLSLSLTAMRARMPFFSNTRTFVPGDSTTPVRSLSVSCPVRTAQLPTHCHVVPLWGCQAHPEKPRG